MTDLGLTTPPPLCLSTSITDQQQIWEQWVEVLECYFTAACIQSVKRRKALLLYIGGEELRTIHKTLGDEDDNYNITKGLFNEHFKSKRNYTFERFKFRKLTPTSEESAVHYITRLKAQALMCNFDQYTTEDAICDQYIEKCQDSKLQARLLSDSKLNTDRLVEQSSTKELVEKYVAAMGSDHVDEVNELSHQQYNRNKSNNNQQSSRYQSSRYDQHQPNQQRYHQSPRYDYSQPNKINKPPRQSQQFNNQAPRAVQQIPNQNRSNQNTSRKRCYCCGANDHFAKDPSCPALGQTCSHCGKMDHFESMCNSKRLGFPKRVNQLNTSKEDDDVQSLVEVTGEEGDEYLFAINNKSDITIRVDDQPLSFLRDSGSTVDMIDRGSLRKLQEKINLTIHPSCAKIYPYGSKNPLPLDGLIYSNIEYQGTHHLARIHISSEENSGNILSRKSAIALGLIEMKESVNTVQHDNQMETLKKQFPGVFKGLGKLKNVQIKFNIDTEVQPVCQHLRRIPFHVRGKLEKRLKRLLELDIIERVEGPTEWVSPVIAVPKGDSIRLCVDMRKPNTAIRRSHKPVPTLEELMDSFNGCTEFSKVDLNDGYHQEELHPDSRDITTFITHCGIFRFKRLVQGVKSALEEYQYHIDSLFTHIKRIRNISDDILIGGRTKEEHDENLKKCFQILAENNLTVNAEKCKIGVKEISFYGHTISADGIHPSTDKVEAIKAFPAPKCQKDIHSFLGMINYLTRFIPNLASETAKLRKLLRKDIPWRWTEEENQVFEKLKEMLTSNLVVAHYDQSLPTSLIVDASPEGIGAILTQEQVDGTLKPVYYASRALTKQEKKYCQTEREALAVVWGCERFHLYLFGIEFTILTDHDPLTIIYSPKGKPSPRILRWGLRLQSYSFSIKHIPGSTNPADMLSIHPIPAADNQAEAESEETETFINTIISYAVPKALTLSEIITESTKDETLTKVRQAVETNNWQGNNHILKPYKQIRNELTVKGGIVLKEDRITIPESLQERTLKLAHESHLGMVKTKAMLRGKVWWPGIDQAVENQIRSCIPCISMSDSKPAPMQFTDMPMSQPWEKVHIDFCGPFPSGDNILGIIDASSRWPEIHITRSTTSETVKNCLEKTFSTHGYPAEIVTDNAPNLTSAEVSEYCENLGIKHHRSTPYWPQGNSEIERFYRTLGKFIKTTNAEGRNWKKEIYKFLLTYRNTPHCTTNTAPSVLLMNRKLRDKIPAYNEQSSVFREAAMHNRNRKFKSRVYYNQNRSAKAPDISVGDHILVKQIRENKLSTPFSNTPYRVTGVRGTAITAENDNHEVTRNVAAVKKIPRYNSGR